MKETLLKLIEDKPKHFNRMIENNPKYQQLKEWIYKQTPELDNDDFKYNIVTRCNWVLTDRHSFPICPTCGKEYGRRKNVKIHEGYQDHCCIKCAQLDKQVRDKIERTSFDRYGTTVPSKSQEVKDKVKKTTKEKYGDENIFKTDYFKQKSKKTCLDKYGVEYTSQVPEIRQKMIETCKNTCMEKYGVDNVMKVPEILDKMINGVKKIWSEHKDELNEKQKQTKLERYGTLNMYSVPEFKEKRDKTNLERYGNIHTVRSESVIKKIKTTMMERYGFECAMYNEKFRQDLKKRMVQKYGVECSFELPEVREKIRQTNLKLYGYMYGRPSKYKFNNQLFDSSWELSFWIYHTDMKNNIERVQESFKYNDGKKDRYYIPDFRLNGILLEIKGDQFFDKNGNMINPYDKEQDYIYNAKYKCMIDNNVKILKRDDIIPYLDYVVETYGKEYMDKFKIMH